MLLPCRARSVTSCSTRPNPDGSFPFAVTKAAQFGLYAQDEWSPLNNLKVTFGIRGDLPVIYFRHCP